MRLTQVPAAATGVSFQYHNGSQAGHHAILESLGGGLALFDYDGDGRLDLFCLGGGRYGADRSISGLPSALFRNLGDWKFQDITAASGAGRAPYYTHGCSMADYNGDGFADILVTGFGGLQLFRNQGDGTFVEISRQAGLTDDSWSSSAAWGDLNGDGHLDLYVVHYVNWSFDNDPQCPGPQPGMREICSPREFIGLPDTVYYSHGDGTFWDATSTAGLKPDGKGLGVLLADVDHDGDLDIYVANDTVDNFLYLNDGRGVFQELALLAGVARSDVGSADGSMGVDLGDFNGDLLPDIFVANFEQEAFALYRNDGDGQFLHVSRATGITALGRLFVGFGLAFADVDRDGDEDILVSNGHVINYPQSAPIKQDALLLLNDKRRQFRRATLPDGGYMNEGHRGRGLALGDVDDDGDLDVVFSHDDDEPVALVSNETESRGGWLRVRLVGRVSHRDAIGARLILETSAGRQLRHVKGGGSYLSQSDLRPFWGIPKGASIEQLVIAWPSGRIQTVSPIDLNRTMTILESSSAHEETP